MGCLWDVYSTVRWGTVLKKQRQNFYREEQTLTRLIIQRAQAAKKDGIFNSELASVTIKGPKVTLLFQLMKAGKSNFEKMPAQNQLSIKTGRSQSERLTINEQQQLFLVREYKSQAKFKIVSYASHAQNPTWFTTAPIEAANKALAKANLKLDQIDLFEVNEAFAVVALAAMKELKLDHSKVNIYGGGVSLGHPIGCSGTRIVVTLMTAMENKKAKYGMAAICIGGGEALALVLERL